MLYNIEHVTRLELDSPVWEHQCEVRLTPRTNRDQKVVKAEVCTEPTGEMGSYVDSFGNVVHTLALIEPHESLEVRLSAGVETLRENPFDFPLVQSHEERNWYRSALTSDPKLWDYVLTHAASQSIASDVHEAEIELPGHEEGRTIMQSVQEAMDWIGANFQYRVGVTHVHSTLAEVLQARAGVCQDFAHLLILIVRSWGAPARYVMGYLDPSEDAGGAPHAWAEVLVPGAGWLGFDATHNLVVNDHYVTVNVGRDYADAAPLRGSFKGEAHSTPPEVVLRVARDQQ